jgi:hypothetical protein
VEEPIKLVSLLASILSIAALFRNVFFVPALAWPDRFNAAAEGFSIAFAVCLVAGYLFARVSRERSAWRTLPMQMLWWSTLILAVMLSGLWYYQTQILPTQYPAR